MRRVAFLSLFALLSPLACGGAPFTQADPSESNPDALSANDAAPSEDATPLPTTDAAGDGEGDGSKLTFEASRDGGEREAGETSPDAAPDASDAASDAPELSDAAPEPSPEVGPASGTCPALWTVLSPASCPAACGGPCAGQEAPEYLWMGCAGAATPSECQACGMYSCACVLAHLSPGLRCSGAAPSCSQETGLVTLTCP